MQRSRGLSAWQQALGHGKPNEIGQHRISAPPPVSDGAAAERVIKGLKTANRNLRAQLRDMKAFYEEQSRLKGVMPQKTYAKIMMAMHTDRQLRARPGWRPSRPSGAACECRSTLRLLLSTP
jgi:hypothetical protein